ncbi:aldehyde dehydrogenase (acceptor) [Panacagrimonas perspica]|uniref:Aldehyde dehydrogenase (Acceptor) n=1 Tax=Panacagrimonas perspica TaxID=381431 RepID=A0A4R7PD78_9GAMM|nr:aldehyde dehydrogenase family protein [Panacagrimonas perspica]TDU31682.1 aldehyde dehydrogenase (acceptor) [Panacagrimonas perspica]THD03102.1 betaine-aldehyde dehydrogenase [Panacagrimonas perspica]
MKTHDDVLRGRSLPGLLLIDGESVPAVSGRTFETIDPATGKVLGQVADGDAADIDRAVAAARRALEGPWSRFKPIDRQRVLLRLADLVEAHFDDLVLLDILDMGVPIGTLAPRRTRAVAMLRYYASLAVTLHGQTIENSLPGEVMTYTIKEPVGVVGAINPWNSPLVLSIWKIAPALATGCAIVLKPAEQAPLAPLRFGALCLEAGVPPGVVNVVPGHRAAGAALAEHRDVDKIAFTGSTEVGQSIIRASAGNVKRVSLELGGKSPNIVFADADLDRAVPAAAMAVFANSGQNCLAGSRLFVQRPIYDQFLERLAAFTRALRVGDPLVPETQLGPVVSHHQMTRVCDYIDKGRAAGARLLVGGKRLDDSAHANGYFIQPTVFADVDDGMAIAREEIFGPVICALPFDTEDEVIRRANATSYGLGCGIWTLNIHTAHRVMRRLRNGTVWVNCYNLLDVAVPFGGYKMSGYGRESGLEHVEEFLHTKSVLISVQ